MREPIGFPRVSGDDPGPLRGWSVDTMFSPRERDDPFFGCMVTRPREFSPRERG